MIISCFTRWKLPTETFVSLTTTNGFTELYALNILLDFSMGTGILLTRPEVVVPSETHTNRLHLNLHIPLWRIYLNVPIRWLLQCSLMPRCASRYELNLILKALALFRMNGTGLRQYPARLGLIHDRICLFVAGLENLAH